MAGRVETITFNGIKFRRYPDAPGLAEQRYYVPGIADRKRGVRRLHEEIWKATHGRDIPEGCHIHHADGDHLNNDPSNLRCLDAETHLEHHGSMPRSEAQLAHWPNAQRAAAIWHGSEAGRAWHSEHGRRTWEGREPETHTCQQCGASYDTRARHGAERFCSNACKSAWRRAAGLDDQDRTCEQCGATFRVNRYAKTRFCGRACAARYRHARRRAGLESDGR